MTRREPSAPMRRIRGVVGLGLAGAWVVYLMLWGPEGTTGDLLPPVLENPTPGQRADYRWSLVDLDGRRVDFAAFRGRAVFLNIWATDCPPCVDELPAIAHLAAHPALRDVVFACVAGNVDLETVRRFVRERKVQVPVYWTAADAVPEVFLTVSIPATFIIAPDGRIVVAQTGTAQWDDPAVVDFLKQLAGPAPIPAAHRARPDRVEQETAGLGTTRP